MTKVAASPARKPRRRWRIWLALIGAFAVVQSITVTPPLEITYVEDSSGAPVENLPILAVWRLYATNPAGGVPSTVLKVQQVMTDKDGKARLGMSLLPHAPALPFSLDIRQARALPALYVTDARYEARMATHDPFHAQRPLPWSVLSLQRTSLDGGVVRLSPALPSDADRGQRRESEILRSMFLDDVENIYFNCRRRWLCQEDKIEQRRE